jgi:hypothetical protein
MPVPKCPPQPIKAVRVKTTTTLRAVCEDARANELEPTLHLRAAQGQFVGHVFHVVDRVCLRHRPWNAR